MICREPEKMPQRRRRGLAVSTGAAGALMLGILVAEAGGLHVNLTTSMPRGIWRIEVAWERIERGEIVSVCPPDTPVISEAARRGYIPAGACPGGREPLIKPVAAISGDLVTVTARGIDVNGELVAENRPLEKDSGGRPLRSIPAGTYRVTADAVWLLSGHDPRSFDSRYFGAVPLANIQGIARPVWVIRVIAAALLACATNIAPATLEAVIEVESRDDPLLLHVNGLAAQPRHATDANEAAELAGAMSRGATASTSA